MNNNIAIKIENLSKQYRLGVVGTGTLSHDLKRWWTMNIRGNEDPYLKIGETNILSTSNPKPQTSNPQYIWALKDINLEINQGDVVGIIGKNGAGKSTLLKILSRVTKPTTGTIKYKGRIASLLEVGTGFHPEMTGRENIYMNGAIMGMTRAEITRKFDEIVDFAGVERYIDTPVKRYSSGMTVRLGFSIAAHLEPDILVVDEVLAVGDAEFQKKAIGKMQDVSKGGGRTVLFVSHNMGAVSSLCNKGYLIESGYVKEAGNVDDIIKMYLKGGRDYSTSMKDYILNPPEKSDEVVTLNYIKITDSEMQERTVFNISESIGMELKYRINKAGFDPKPNIHLFYENGVKVLISVEPITEIKKDQSEYISKVWIPKDFLNEGSYRVGFALSSLNPVIIHSCDYDAVAFEVIDNLNSITRSSFTGKFDCLIRPKLNWETNKL